MPRHNPTTSTRQDGHGERIERNHLAGRRRTARRSRSNGEDWTRRALATAQDVGAREIDRQLVGGRAELDLRA